jgi:hypothetical protein
MLQKQITPSNEQATAAVGIFTPIDTAGFARDFKIEGIARERGKRNLPETHDTKVDALEQKIIQKIEDEWMRQGGELLNSLQAFAGRLVSCSVPGEFLRLQIKAEHVLAWLRVATGKALRDLTSLQRDYLSARDELERFRKRNNLCRPVQMPANRWAAAGHLFIFAAIESVLSAVFFAESTKVGLAGGISAAVIVSLTNVALAFLFGLGPLRWRNHRDRFISTSGRLFTLAGIVIIVVLHLFGLHFCVAVPFVGDDGFFAFAAEVLHKASWASLDATSFYILGLGMVFALGAMWRGYSFDDPYPQYGATCRREKSALEAYASGRFALLGELGEVIEDTVVQIDDGSLRLPQFRRAAIDMRARRAVMLNGFRAYETALETATNQLLRLYRDINHAQRTTAPPFYFEEKWRLPRSFLMSAELKSLLADPEPGDVAANVAELGRLSQAIICRHNLLQERYPQSFETDSTVHRDK